MEKLSFENVYSKYHKDVLNTVMYKIGKKNKEIAEELTNDVFMRVHKHFSEYDSKKSAMKTWLYNITNNIIIDYWRKKEINVFSIDAHVNGEGNEIFQKESYFKNPFDELSNCEIGETINDKINSLPELYRELSKMFFIEQYSHKEIIEKTSLPLGTIKGQISRARKLLQTMLF